MGTAFFLLSSRLVGDLPQDLGGFGVFELGKWASAAFADLRFCDAVVIWSLRNVRFMRVSLILFDITNCDFIAHNPEVVGSNPTSAISRIDLPSH